MKALPRRILVPVDFERGSRRALRYARALASASHGEICLLHVVPMPPGHRMAASDRWWMELAERTLAGVRDRARLAPGTTTEVLQGQVAPLVGKYACDNNFDLVVLSGRTTPDWHGSLLGTTATSILRHTRVPVLIVPANVRAARAPRPVALERRPA